MSVGFLLLFCRNLSSPSPSFSFSHSKKERQQTHRAKGGVERNRRGRGRGMAPRGSGGGRGRRRGRRRQPPLRVELRKVLLVQVSPGDGLARRSADHQQEAPATAVSYCVVSGGRNELFFRSLDLSRSLARSDPRAPDRTDKKSGNFKSTLSPFRDEEPAPSSCPHLQVPQRGPEHPIDYRPRPQRLAHRRVRQPHPGHRLWRQRATEVGDAPVLFFAESRDELGPGVKLAQEAGDGGARGLVAGEELNDFCFFQEGGKKGEFFFLLREFSGKGKHTSPG